MSYNTGIRNLRDGSLSIKDNATHTCTVVCDEGDLNWREQQEVKVQKCRGALTSARTGDAIPLELNCTFKWANLIQHTLLSSDPIVPYELINNVGSEYTSWDTGYFCLKWEFSVASPDGVSTKGEKITFSKVWKTSLDCREGDEANTVAFSGMSLAALPTIARLS
ncbi:hypothetical protein AYO47_03850 [Planctomyces sp. SCGC AG-212-M04]|nr:hypothetical protein AYO47_03850 [Planctomyces sp. SCGC AG-212-M04]